MTSILAFMSEPTSYSAIGWVAVTLFSIAAGTNQLLHLLDRSKEKPAPSETYVTREHCATLHQQQHEQVRHWGSRLDALENSRLENISAMNEQLDSIRAEIKNDIRSVHTRIDELVRAVGRIEGKS